MVGMSATSFHSHKAPKEYQQLRVTDGKTKAQRSCSITSNSLSWDSTQL